jgi:hypothetical protein
MSLVSIEATDKVLFQVQPPKRDQHLVLQRLAGTNILTFRCYRLKSYTPNTYLNWRNTIHMLFRQTFA